ncbi:MAG: esterase [Terrimonas sp.]|nr:esterase [Terrimonas sp.]
MQEVNVPGIHVERTSILSVFLKRKVEVDFYMPRQVSKPEALSLLLINDGQDLPKFHFDRMLARHINEGIIAPLFCVGIHCSEERRMEYGTASQPDFMGRGAKAELHKQFVLEELIPYIQTTYRIRSFRDKSYAGFSLGGLSAIDVVWSMPGAFIRAGVFSGSLWWRRKDLDEGYIEATDRIMHKLVREGKYSPGLKFFFTTGSLDEKMDRNNNGVIDSIDDTLGLIEELVNKGYSLIDDIVYINYKDGKHDVETWGRAMPEFLKWGWGQIQP